MNTKAVGAPAGSCHWAAATAVMRAAATAVMRAAATAVMLAAATAAMLAGCLTGGVLSAGPPAPTPPPAWPEAAPLPPCTDASSPECSPVGRDWVFVEIDGFEGTLPAPPPVAGFILTTEGRGVSGSTACNRLGGDYQIDLVGRTLRFVDLRNGRALCDRVAADTEEAVLEAMIATDGFRLSDPTHLELLSGDKVVARLVVP